jgi:class 3 adenylate cyclase
MGSDVVLATERTARPSTGRDTPHALTAYLPRILGDWLTDSPARTHRAVDGTLVFADISGFTRLTERLSRLGRVGAEEMSDALNATFTQLLGEAHADGADLVKWGGDAVLLLFDGPGHAARAARAAYRMRGRLRTVGKLSTSAGHAQLRMSVGVHSGTIHFFLVGDPALHRELIVCGPDVSVVAEVEARASAGQIALSPTTCALLPPELLGAPVGDVGLLLRRCPSRRRTAYGGPGRRTSYEASRWRSVSTCCRAPASPSTGGSRWGSWRSRARTGC